jgi:peptidoglycan LD-endopeptidase CwlK
MAYSYGTKSEARLVSCKSGIVAVFREVIKHVDCSVLEGSRTDARQIALYNTVDPVTGKRPTTLDGVIKRSKHQVTFDDPLSGAIDAIPYPTTLHGIDIWSDTTRFTLFAGEVLATGWALGVDLIWGGDWDGDGSRANQSFHDLPHFEERTR